MYLRYRAKYFNHTTQKLELGFFRAADYLKKNGILQREDREKLESLIHYFDHNLPIPDYYQKEKNRQSAKSATSWFKDSSDKYISRMNELADILEQYHIEVERIHSKKLSGKKIYEDDFQVTILPFRDTARQVK